eukprot:2628215-Rhodomonas_salina.1
MTGPGRSQSTAHKTRCTSPHTLYQSEHAVPVHTCTPHTKTHRYAIAVAHTRHQPSDSLE